MERICLIPPIYHIAKFVCANDPQQLTVPLHFLLKDSRNLIHTRNLTSHHFFYHQKWMRRMNE